MFTRGKLMRLQAAQAAEAAQAADEIDVFINRIRNKECNPKNEEDKKIAIRLLLSGKHDDERLYKIIEFYSRKNNILSNAFVEAINSFDSKVLSNFCLLLQNPPLLLYSQAINLLARENFLEVFLNKEKTFEQKKIF